jgi:hypothetical protein
MAAWKVHLGGCEYLGDAAAFQQRHVLIARALDVSSLHQASARGVTMRWSTLT